MSGGCRCHVLPENVMMDFSLYIVPGFHDNHFFLVLYDGLNTNYVTLALKMLESHYVLIASVHIVTCTWGERGGSVVECWTPEREVRGSRPTAAVLCPWARHFTPRKYWLITQEAMAPSRHDWKIVDWDVKPQHNQQPVLEGWSLSIEAGPKQVNQDMSKRQNQQSECASSKDSDQPRQPPSLIKVFAVRSMGS